MIIIYGMSMTSHIPKSAEDWNSLWKLKQAERPTNHDEAFWDKRASSFSSKDAPDTYADGFLSLAALLPGESVFDMGCGTGLLTLPLARQGHEVLAADISGAMLKILQRRLDDDGISGVRTLKLSWDDDWMEKSVMSHSADVCIASRSLITDDLLSALRKLTQVARRRACITLGTGSSPRIHDQMLEDIGIRCAPCLDDVYALAMLSADGYLPEMSIVHTHRRDAFDDMDAAFAKYSNMVKMATMQDPAPWSEAIRAWLGENLICANDADHLDALTLKEPRRVSWAFISWDK